MSEVNRGSQWRKWDLHVHSPYNILKGSGSYNGVTDDMFIEKLKGEEISAIGLTNYFKFDERDYILADKLREANISVFMNLELRLTNINDTQMLSDYHIIFSDKVSKEEINNFLYNLNVTIGSQKKKINNLKEEDIKNAAINFDELCSTLQDESLSLKGKYLTAFLSRGHGNSVCGKNRGYTVYEEITRKSDFLIHSTDFRETLEEDRKYWLGNGINKNKYVRALLQTSDAHCLEDIGFKIKQVEEKNKDRSGVYEKGGKYFIKVPSFTWIKSDLTFEGLKQIIYEPEERIRYGETHPDTKSDYMVIDYVEYNEGKRIYFNRGLNAIIGGRSTGKSTLLNSIAKYQNNKNFGEDDSRYILQYGYSEFKVVWADGKEDTLRPVEFIPQEFMISISDDRNSNGRNKLNELLGEIISKKNMDSEERQYREKIQDIDRDMRLFLDDYMKFVNDKKQLIKPEGDKDEETKIVEDLEERYQKIRLENKFSDEENEEYKNLCVEKEKLEKKLNNLNKEKDKLKKIRDLDFYLYVDLEDISIYNKSLIENILEEIRKSSKEKWEVFIKELLSKSEESYLNKYTEHKKIINSEIFKKGEVLKENNDHIKGLEKQLATHKKNILEIERYEKQLLDIEKRLEDLSRKIIEKFVEYFKAIEELKKNFKLEENELKIEIKIIVPDFEEEIEYLNSKKSVNRDFIEKFNNSINNILEEESKEFLKSIFKDDNLVFNKNKNMYDLIKDIFGKNWYKFDYLITYQNDEFQEMSQGKKSFVILKLLLEFSDDKKPVLIDQPEDSFDNRAIYNELRKYLLDTKKNRQVIVVTHNPNVVVGADAENVIVANQHNNIEKNEDEMKFQYVNGSLENTRAHDKNCEYILCSQGIREHIFDVLEGGKEAFAKREQKYNYKEINNKHES